MGLICTVANGVIHSNGRAIGALPQFLHQVEIARPNLTELIIVETMHERKSIMNDLSAGVSMLRGV